MSFLFIFSDMMTSADNDETTLARYSIAIDTRAMREHVCM